MKYSVFCVLLCFVASGNCVLRHTNIGKFVEGIVRKIGNHSLAIPKDQHVDKHTLEQAFIGFRNIIDDPLTINDQQLNYEMDNVVKIRGHVKNLEIKSLKTMRLDHIYMSPDTLYTEIVIAVPQLRVTGLYNTSCYLNRYDFDLYGNGSFQWDLNEFKIKANITLQKMTTEFMQLKKISVDQSFNSSKFEIKNLLNDEDVSSVVSEIVSIVIPPLHNYFKPTINEFVTQLITLNSELLFSSITLEEFIGIIQAFKDKATNNNVV